MKTQLITTITAVLLILFTVSVNAQTKEDYLRLRDKNNRTKAENDAARRELEKKLSNLKPEEVVQKQVEKGSGTAEVLLEWNNAVNSGKNAVDNNQLETASMWVSSLQPGEDFEVETNNKTIKLKSYRGFEAYTHDLSESLKQYNEDLSKYKEACEEYKKASEKASSMWNDERYSVKEKNAALDDAKAKLEMKNDCLKKVENSQNNALKYAEVLSENSNDPTFKKKIDDIVDPLTTRDITGEKYRANVTENSKAVSDDYKNLMTNYLPGCTDCGK